MRKTANIFAHRQHDGKRSNSLKSHNYQLLDEVEQNIVIFPWRADQLFVDQINYLPMPKAEANN